MLRATSAICLALTLTSCGPPLVWGGNEATKERLLKIVPLGSQVSELEAEAEARQWRLRSDDRVFPKGEPHYLAEGCEHQGGVRRGVIIAEYGLLTTSVETSWLFDEEGKLASLCIRRTTDSL